MAPPTPPARRWYQRGPWPGLIEIDAGIFEGLLLVYLGLLLTESLRSGTVTRYLNLNLLLVPVLVTGIIAVLGRPEPEPERPQPLSRRDYVLVAATTLGAWLILWYQLRSLGRIQYPVSILGGLLVGLVALSVLWPEPTPPMGPPAPEPRPISAAPAPTLIRFSCPTCRLEGAVGRAQAGARLVCPRCKTIVTVPRPDATP